VMFTMLMVFMMFIFQLFLLVFYISQSLDTFHAKVQNDRDAYGKKTGKQRKVK
jgi:hypothetical protein